MTDRPAFIDPHVHLWDLNHVRYPWLAPPFSDDNPNGSVEAIHWLNDLIGAAAFVDVGDAFDQLSDLRPAAGYGIGARVRTPIGPFRLDVAYGQRTRGVRLHFSVGLAF